MAFPSPYDISYDEDSRWCSWHGHTGLLAGCEICDRLIANAPSFAAALSTATPPGRHNPDGSLAGAHWVVCSEYVLGPFGDKAQADTRITELARDPSACPASHWVKKSDAAPDPGYPPDGWTPVLPATS